MNFEKYTERARGFVQSAQTYALGQGHQQFTPEHLLKVLLDDPEGMAAGLIERAGGRPRTRCSPRKPRSPSCRKSRAARASSISRRRSRKVFDHRRAARREGRR